MGELRTFTAPRSRLDQDPAAPCSTQLVDLELRVLIACRHPCVAEHLAHRGSVPILGMAVINRTLISAQTSGTPTRRRRPPMRMTTRMCHKRSLWRQPRLRSQLAHSNAKTVRGRGESLEQGSGRESCRADRRKVVKWTNV